MGLFSIFGKKDLEAEQKLLKKIEELEQTIARKDKEISDLINELDRVIGRDKEIARTVQILSRRTKNNPC